MRHRLLLLMFLAGAAVPAHAQQPDSEQKLRQEIEAMFTAWLDALNRGDGKAAAAFFVPNAPAINPNGIVRGGGQEQANRIELQHQQNSVTTAKIDQVQAVGSDAAYAVGPWRSTFGPAGESQVGGMWLQLYERRGDTWKISASSFSRVGPVTNPANPANPTNPANARDPGRRGRQ
jgi:ketosteroid isomerase-like protein